MKKSKRYERFNKMEVNKDVFLKELPEAGMICWDSPNDPKPSLKIENGRIVELDGKLEKDFDLIDRFIAKYSIDLDVAKEAMAMDSIEFGRKLVDINVPREEIIRLAKGMTPAKLTEVVKNLDVVEMMMAAHKLRARRVPADQTHVCNHKDDLALLMADAATAAATGFAEIEATVGIARNAPAVALGILLGSQIGRPGVLTQCAVEEATELSLGMKGFTSYAETVSVYGTEKVFVDGDDLPWSKMFLASAYASRGIKLRFTSGTGSEVLMGACEGKSMLYLEARCILMILGCGVQGVQNGGVSCASLSASMPAGQLNVMAENLISMMLGLEVASGNDGQWSGSEARRWAHVFPWLCAGTDYIHSGFGYTSVWDNMFSGANFNYEDLDDELALQRDFKVDTGLRSLKEEEYIAIRAKAAKIAQDLCEEMGWPRYTDEQIEKVIYCDDSRDIDREQKDNFTLNKMIIDSKITLVDIIRALQRKGHTDLAQNLIELLKCRLAGDYLHTAAVLDKNYNCFSGVNTPNDYAGPGTGYRVEGERWEEIKRIRQEIAPEDFIKQQMGLVYK